MFSCIICRVNIARLNRVESVLFFTIKIARGCLREIQIGINNMETMKFLQWQCWTYYVAIIGILLPSILSFASHTCTKCYNWISVLLFGIYRLYLYKLYADLRTYVIRIIVYIWVYIYIYYIMIIIDYVRVIENRERRRNTVQLAGVKVTLIKIFHNDIKCNLAEI